ncbi:MAG: proline dehydrogenase family protein [Actinomycetota bacterium]|nr:proline dehydrogenase family protein [Actinomycetota bacterium]
MRSSFLRRQALARAGRYVAGETLSDALVVVRRLVGAGLAVSVDRFGEAEADVQMIASVVDEYRRLARAVEDVEGDVYLEVVPSHVGIDVSVEFFCEQARRIAAVLPDGARLEVSAENSSRTPRIVDAVLRVASTGVPVVATVQANLRRSTGDAQMLVDGGVPIRLVKGAYVEPADVAYAWGEPTNVAFVRLAHEVHQRGGRLAIATHDPVIREALLPALNDVEVEMLLGVRPEDALELVDRGHLVRIYVPYGTAWFRYWMRRVAEARGA